jgi:hypothetical protein
MFYPMFFNVLFRNAHVRNINLLSKRKRNEKLVAFDAGKTLAPVSQNQFIVGFRAALKPKIFALGELLKEVTVLVSVKKKSSQFAVWSDLPLFSLKYQILHYLIVQNKKVLRTQPFEGKSDESISGACLCALVLVQKIRENRL